MNYPVFISCAKGLEYLLDAEVRQLGLQITRVSPQGVYGEAELAIIYHLCLWSRLANRVQIILFSGEAFNEQTLYQLCYQFPWQTVFSPEKTLAISFHGTSKHLRNSMFGAQVVKDAIVDHFQKQQHKRPSIDKDSPDIRLHAWLKNDNVTVSLDLSGYSLHQRGYRNEAGDAPLKETLAAALLYRMQWPQLAEKGYDFLDPFCGSGTLVIEAAMMAAQIAPGLLRDDHALHHWAQHQPSLWEKIRTQALAQVKPVKIKISGSDNQAKLIKLAIDNAKRAGVSSLVEFTTQELADCRTQAPHGLLLGNPPYGERLGDPLQLIPLYQQLGQVLHDHFKGWHAGILTTNPMLAKAIGLRAQKNYSVYNGALECKLYCFTVDDRNQLKNTNPGNLSTGAQMFANRLQKNLQHLQKWAKRNTIHCYRIYDADLPEYAFAIDLYNDYAVLQEYTAPASIPAHIAERRSLDVIQIVPAILKIPNNHLVVKKRTQQKGTQQYQKMAQTNNFMTVVEGDALLQVNLQDYLDTGVFLDHRLLRLRFAKLAAGTRFLNCFCYTATASIHAALAGAITTNIDLSNTYLNWAQENFRLNDIDVNRHQFVQFDCLQWLQLSRDRFDVIFLDPPSFSNSKRMQGTLDIQRDHEQLIDAAMKLLDKGGILYFSTNLRQFKLAQAIYERYQVKDISAQTIDVDFKRDKRIHHCFIISSS